jgi:hypothetical protein
MINLIPFKLFESEKKLHPNGEEFLLYLEKFPHKDIFNSWFTVEPRSTGRVSIKGGHLPSQTRFEKNSDGIWTYHYSASGKDYGHQKGNLHDLFMQLMKDSVKKGAPSYLNKKDMDTILADDKWFFSSLTDKEDEIYKKIQSKLQGESGIVLDFTELELPGVKNLQNLGLLSKTFKGKLGEISYVVIREDLDDSHQGPFWSIVNKVVSKEDPKYYTRLSNVDSMTFYPKGTGISARSTNDKMQIDIGAVNEEEAVKMIEKTVMKYMLKNSVVVNGDVSKETRAFVDSLYHQFIKSSIEGTDVNVILDEYFLKNPLDLWFLDPLPNVKAGVLKRTGLRDVSGLGRSMKLGVV